MTAPIRSLRLLPRSKTELDRLSGNKGEIFYDSTSNSLRIFNGSITGGTLLNASVSVKTTPPDNPTQGSLWFNSDTGAFYIYYQDGSSNQWVAPIVPAGLLGSGGSGSGTVLSGLSGKLAYYPTNGTAVNDLTEVSWGSNALNITGAVTTTGQKSRVRFHWDTLTSLQSEVDATTYQGMIAYAADSARPYFAHNGSWVALAKQSEVQSSSSFGTISVSGQSNVVADQTNDILTLVAGSGISITTDTNSDTITITSTVNPSSYVTSSSLTSTLSSYATTASVTTSLASYATTSSLTTGLSSKEPSITVGTTSQYWRGDKSWQTLDATAVGLGNVTNESKATMFTDPTFTGTVSGVTATHVGLGNVTNESKATMFSSPTFTGDVSLDVIKSGAGGISVSVGTYSPAHLTIDNSNFTVRWVDLTIDGSQGGGNLVFSGGGSIQGVGSGTPSQRGLGFKSGNNTTMLSLTTVSGAQFSVPVVVSQTIETLSTKTGATGTVAHDFNTGTIWYHTSIAANFTANFTNMPTTSADRTFVHTLLLVQGSTAYIPNAVQIAGSAQTIKWLGSSAPSGNANKVDIVSFTLIYTGSTWTVLGSLSTYG